MLEQLLLLDGGVLLWIQAHLRAPVQDAAIGLYTKLGNAGLLFIALALVLLCFKKTRKAGFAALVALVFGVICTNLLLKNLVARPRPWVALVELLPLVEEHDPSSFPSGHTTAAFAFAAAVWNSDSKRWMKWGSLSLAILMGYSRLHVGVHYPSDVLAGVCIGLFAGWAAWKFTKKLAQKM